MKAGRRIGRGLSRIDLCTYGISEYVYLFTRSGVCMHNVLWGEVIFSVDPFLEEN